MEREPTLIVKQIEHLFSILIHPDSVWEDSSALAEELGVGESELLNALPTINRLSDVEIWHEPLSDSFGKEKLWIPPQFKDRIRSHFRKHEEGEVWDRLTKRKREKFLEAEEAEQNRRALEDEAKRLEVEALRLQIEDFPKARRERIITRWIAIGAAITSLVALIAQIASR